MSKELSSLEIDQIRRFLTKDIELNGRRVVGAGNSRARQDYVTRAELNVTGTRIDSLLPSVKDTVSLINQTADKASTNFLNSSTIGLYRVSYVLLVTTADATAGAVTLSISWTDDASAFSVSSTALVLTALGRTSGEFIIRLNSGSIAYSTTHTGSYGTAVYALYMTLERLN